MSVTTEEMLDIASKGPDFVFFSMMQVAIVSINHPFIHFLRSLLGMKSGAISRKVVLVAGADDLDVRRKKKLWE